MSWAKLDDRANEHRKQLAAGADACWLWACGLMYANRQQARDGFIPDQMLPMLYPLPPGKRVKLVAKLLEVGLWVEAPGGYQIHDFADWNETADERTTRLAANGRRVALTRSPGLRQLLKQRDGDACRYCGDEVSWVARRGPKAATYDHVVAMARGGSDEPDNIVVCCQACNLKKGARTPEEAGMRLRPEPGSVPRSDLGHRFRSDLENPGPLHSATTPLPARSDQPEATTQGPDRSTREGPSVVVVVPQAIEPKVPCPADLELTSGQRSQLTLGKGMNDYQVDELTQRFRANFTADPDDKRPLVAWRKCLSMWIAGQFSDPRHRPPRSADEPETETQLRDRLRRGPRQPNHFDHSNQAEHLAAIGAVEI